MGRNEFLTFTLGDEEYGIDILKVQEIRGYKSVTSIANAPSFIKGVINLRGLIVPIIDMRIKFALDNIEYNQFTVVIIINVAGHILGVVVDSVSDVVLLRDEEIKEPPAFGSALDTRYILGMGVQNERMIILMDIEKLMTSQELAIISEVIN